MPGEVVDLDAALLVVAEEIAAATRVGEADAVRRLGVVFRGLKYRAREV